LVSSQSLLSQARAIAACTLCASLPQFLTLAQGGRFVLVSAAGLGLMRGCDSLMTSDLRGSSAVAQLLFGCLIVTAGTRYYRREPARARARLFMPPPPPPSAHPWPVLQERRGRRHRLQRDPGASGHGRSAGDKVRLRMLVPAAYARAD